MAFSRQPSVTTSRLPVVPGRLSFWLYAPPRAPRHAPRHDARTCSRIVAATGAGPPCRWLQEYRGRRLRQLPNNRDAPVTNPRARPPRMPAAVTPGIIASEDRANSAASQATYWSAVSSGPGAQAPVIVEGEIVRERGARCVTGVCATVGTRGYACRGPANPRANSSASRTRTMTSSGTVPT